MKPDIGIVCYPTLGGSGVVATELGKSIAARGHKVHFITHGIPSRLSHFDENLFFHKVELGEYPLFQPFSQYPLNLAAKIREVVDQYDLDIVHVHYAIPYAACAFLAKEMLKPKRVRTITTLHGTDITLVGLMPSFYEITRFSISVSDAVTAVSQFLKDETIRAFQVDQLIHVIHNFVDCNEFRPQRNASIRDRLAPNGEKLIIHASNFRKVKNIPVVIEVFDKVRSWRPCRLILIGDGPERESAERQATDLGIAKDVVFMGDQEFIADILPVADVFVLPSEHESFGLAALEAMSCGLPVVASNVGGLHEVIDHKETGYLCDPHDVQRMAVTVSELLGDEDKRRSIGLKARERAKRGFSKERIVNEYLKLYNTVLEA
ncbi:MAG: N-acetyl-alpha-D-glucosaminyl L-malate synthase BshA [Candidatus Latescibacteria bacterium]|nr:N-acetyl-alpha-D-glucosaminyl L-malate synthase BshA [Candidatus Latescibacterota bacterium]NIM20932.1 N-acetyl-alpha-D-glucosaminyl L-malate synthase BshA [Candidatus Latescibacterota bacterium]NIM65067.1 N-acetyl-alpha-D-glucosaminyl L-malate synthase BshA [Candidatus Latescibacterota bacterium]NIO01582.1 N-acetyl-alpha-D-glucosaminyl L-malate synthase BshA [Candidatus Latescibacterota bacterium]NIO28099.1 N-acetyl-alpha-D-glucosaminyl L-malate synthase BshA [Candidatus Latescibacterota ba